MLPQQPLEKRAQIVNTGGAGLAHKAQPEDGARGFRSPRHHPRSLGNHTATAATAATGANGSMATGQPPI